MNSVRKGEQQEAQVSAKIHLRPDVLPLLISPLVLRGRGAGQVDVSCLRRRNNKLEVVVVETKSSLRLSPVQRQRLIKSCSFLSAVFSSSVSLWYTFGMKGTFANSSRPFYA